MDGFAKMRELLIKKFAPLTWVFIFFFSLAAFSSAYWFVFVHPYFWIASGRIQAASLQIKSPEEGILTQLPLEPGDRIDRGALLFCLENTRLAEEQKRTKLLLSDLDKKLLSYKNQSEEAMQNYLSDLGVKPQHEVDQHLQTLQATQLKINQIQEQMQTLSEEERHLLQQQAQLSSPSTHQAIVLKRQKAVGDFVQIGEPIATVLDLDSCWIEAKASEKTLHLLHIDQEVDIYLAAYPQQSWKGKISWIGPATLSQLEGSWLSTGEEMIPLKISVRAEKFPLKPGLSATIRVKKIY